MFEKIYQQHWLDLDKETREHLAKTFGMQRSGIAEIRDQLVVSDGYTNGDLESITKEKMEEYVGSEASYARLWELTLAKARFELHPPIGEIRVPEERLEAKERTEEDVKTKASEQDKKRTSTTNRTTTED